MLNIQSRNEFDRLLADLSACTIMAVDTETNGLNYYRGNYPISMSFWFPEFERGYNFPFLHGEGQVIPRWNVSNPEGTPYEKMNWAGFAKKDMLLAQQFAKLKSSIDFGNCPVEWLEELKPLWDKPTHVYHNAKFDMHMLASIGFPVPTNVIDTMLLLHIIYNDWHAMDIVAPYVEDGTWARNPDGSLATKKQMGNRQLKWQAARLGLENATVGEDGLQQAATEFETILSEGAEKPVRMDKKAHMWMLPSEKVWYYAVMDTKLTWQLYQWCLPIIKQWHNEDLMTTFNQSQMAAFVMEQNGFQLDVERAEHEVSLLTPHIKEIESWFDFKLGYAVGLRNYLNTGVLECEWDVPLPEWFPENKRGNTHLYENVYLDDTSAATLEKYEDHMVIRIILEYRQLKKTVDTYLRNWIAAADQNGIVRGNINVDGTNTGRTSSSGDAGNLQNIPERKGYTIKRAIVPYSKEWVMFGIDYGQLEGRLASYVAEDLLVQWGVHSLKPRMQALFNGIYDPNEFPHIDQSRIFKNGLVDLHMFTREVLDVRETLYGNLSNAAILGKRGYNPALIDEAQHQTKVDTELRYLAKTTNFGLLYSGTKYMLSKQLKCELDIAEVLVQRWRKIFPAFAIAQDYFNEQALTRRPNPSKTATGMYVTQPISGRHLKYQLHSNWRYDSDDKRWYNLQESAAKKAWNGIVQGLGGWLTPVSYHRFREKYGDEGIKPFAIIHDAIDGYIHRDYIWKLEKLMDEMCAHPINPVLTVELSMSEVDWQSMKGVEDYGRSFAG